jgi:hydroxymethylpyrimidine/phosphomethylpyrimidine kinase
VSPERPVTLTIAGSDSGGGAGIQADLKTFASIGVHGTSAITCVTSQNPVEVRSIQAMKPEVLRDQIEAVFDELQPAAVKTGMLYSAKLIEVVVECLSERNCPLVVDPVMVATSGARLLKPAAIRILKEQLLPRATLVTPNLEEAALLAKRRHIPKSVEEMGEIALQLRTEFNCPVLVKGGHLESEPDATDVLIEGEEKLLLRAPLIDTDSTHGTGCTYAAAIAAYLALGCELQDAVRMGKVFTTEAITQNYRAGSHGHLNHFWEE